MTLDRIKELDKMSEALEGTTIYKKTVWLIMDKARKVVAKKNIRARTLCMIDDTKDKKQLLVQNTEIMARRMFRYGFFHGKGVDEYLRNTYGEDTTDINRLEVVKATLIVKI